MVSSKLFSKKSKWKNFTHFILTLFLAATFFTACKDTKTHFFSPTPAVEVLKINPQRIVLTSELPGRTVSYRVAGITPRVNGLILKRYFREGAYVQAGSVLYLIDPAPFKAALDNARAALQQAEANHTALKLNADRLKELLPDKAVSRQEYDNALSSVKQAEAQILALKAQIKTAKINLSYTKITAPISGRIGRSAVTEGAVVSAYQTTPLSTIQQMNPIYVDVPRSTSELLHLKKMLRSGAIKNRVRGIRQVGLLLDDGSEYRYKGDLQFTDVTVDESTGSVILRIVFPNPKGDLLPNMFVRAIVKEGASSNAILIPQLAVSRDTKGNAYTFLVNKENKIIQQPLQLERSIGDKWLVTSGLKSGDKVVISGIQRIRPGVTVKVMNEKKTDGQEIITAKTKAKPAKSKPGNGGK